MAAIADEKVVQKDLDLSNPEVVQKYKAAAETSHRAMEKVMAMCKVGTKVVDMCQAGDDFIEAESKKYFPKAKIDRGVAFPTCVSLNNTAGHFSPLKSDGTTLKKGDVVKIDLGAHIDGYLSLAARTLVVEPDGPVTGKIADVITAAHVAMNAAVHLLQIGKTNEEVSEVIKRVAEAYKVKPLEGVLSHQMARFVIDGNKVIMNKPTGDQRVEKCTVEENDVWCIDVVMSTGEGVPRETDQRTTVFKRTADQTYMLKLKASRFMFKEVSKKAPVFPFTLRAFDERQARMGISEMVSHGMVDPYPVLFEKDKEYIAQFKTTVFILPQQTLPAFNPILPEYIKSDQVCEDEVVKSALSLPLSATAAEKDTPAASASAPAPTEPEKKDAEKEESK